MGPQHVSISPGHRSTLSPFARHLSAHERLSPEALRIVEAAQSGARLHPAATEIRLGPAESGAAALTVVSGWAGAVRHMEDGRRQIVLLMLPGDSVEAHDLDNLGLVAQALSQVRTYDLSVRQLLSAGAPEERKALHAACTALRLSVQARLARHIVRLGQLSAIERTADFVLEVAERNARTGGGTFVPCPVSQEVLADHLGLSVVHLNRVLQQLRREGFITFQAGRLVIQDHEGLVRLAS